MARKVVPEKVKEAKENIIEAAFDVISTEGLSQFTLSKVAAKANITKANIYWYFDSKEELLNDMALTLKNIFIYQIQSIYQQPISAKEKIRLIIEGVNSNDISHNCFLILKIFFEVKSSDSSVENIIRNGYKEYLDIVNLIFTDAIKGCELKSDIPPYDLAKFFISSLDACIIQKEIYGYSNYDLQILSYLFTNNFINEIKGDSDDK